MHQQPLGVAVEKGIAQAGKGLVARRHTKSHAHHAPGSRAHHGPQRSQRQGRQSMLSPQVIGSTGQIGRAVHQGAVQIKQQQGSCGAHWGTFVLRTAGFALRAAGRAHAGARQASR
jgi:hypothetical protein